MYHILLKRIQVKIKMEEFAKTSCLSEGVDLLICGLNLEYTKQLQREDEEGEPQERGEGVIGDLNNRVQHLETVAKLSLTKNCDGTINFVNTVKQLIPFCHNVHRHLMQLTLEEFEEKFGMDLDWTGCKERIVECFGFLKKGDEEPVNIILSSLLLFSILERSLGDIYVSYTGLRCLTNLKDLLISEEIQNLLGENVCLMLYTLAGPPEGVNLRNVLWHGFVSPCEIPIQYISFLLFTLATLSSKPGGIQIKKRSMIRLLELKRLCIFPSIEPTKCISAVDQLFSSNLFISPSMLPVWKKALQCHKQQRYDLALVLLLPQLEHSLRRVFAYANKCPKRILTAESTTLYTTFDEILAPSLPDGSENQLRKEIGDEYLHMLLDILVYADGPRLRDRISHGELDLDCIPSEMSNHVLCISVAFASLYSQGLTKNIFICDTNDTCLQTDEKCLPMEAAAKDNQMAEEHGVNNCFFQHSFVNDVRGADQSCTIITPSDNSNTIQQIILKARNYLSVYHPTEILKNDIKDLSEMIDKWEDIPLPEVELECTSNSQLPKSEENKVEMTRVFFTDSKRLILNGVVLDTCHDVEMLLADGQFSRGISSLCDKIKIPTLYRPRKELEIVSIFHSIVHHCSNISAQVINTANQRYQQFIRKELRSRQRTNYKRLLSLLPFLQDVIKTVMVLILTELPSLPTNAGDGTKAGYIRFLKRCLQCSENLESLSSSLKNKWDECKVVGDHLLQIIHMRFS